MKLLIIGTGLLGRKLLHKALASYQVFATYNKHSFQLNGANFLKLNITNQKNCKNIIEKIEPDIVIFSAALTNVDLCEKEKKLAYKINVEGIRNVCKYLDKINSKLVYVSTDYVFNGKHGNYREDDLTNPLNYYGHTKLLGEEIVRSNMDDWIIARTSVLYGFNPVKLNYVTWVLRELKEEKVIKVVTDQYTSPTFVGNLSEMILELLKRHKSGVFHTSGMERINRYEFAQKISDVFKLDRKLIKPIISSDLNWVAERPKDSSLCTDKIYNIVKPLSIEKGLSLAKGELT